MDIFLATQKPAGLIFTTGPGLTNGVSKLHPVTMIISHFLFWLVK